MNTTQLTPDQIQDLREEFIEFEINDMSREEMAAFVRNQKLRNITFMMRIC